MKTVERYQAKRLAAYRVLWGEEKATLLADLPQPTQNVILHRAEKTVRRVLLMTACVGLATQWQAVMRLFVRFFVALGLTASVLAVSLSLPGCTALMTREPITKHVALTDAPDVAYQKATQTMARMGGQITMTNAEQRVLSALVHNVVVMTVSVHARGTGSEVEVSGTLLPDKIAFGTFSEVDEYLALLQKG